MVVNTILIELLSDSSKLLTSLIGICLLLLDIFSENRYLLEEGLKVLFVFSIILVLFTRI